MAQHWIIRVGNGKNFSNSIKHQIWGIASRCKNGSLNGVSNAFMKKAKRGDVLWFVTKASRGHIVGMALYENCAFRDELSLSHKELGWIDEENKFDVEMYYTNYYDTSSLNIRSRVSHQQGCKLYEEVYCVTDLPALYASLTKK